MGSVYDPSAVYTWSEFGKLFILRSPLVFDWLDFWELLNELFPVLKAWDSRGLVDFEVFLASIVNQVTVSPKIRRGTGLATVATEEYESVINPKDKAKLSDQLYNERSHHH